MPVADRSDDAATGGSEHTEDVPLVSVGLPVYNGERYLEQAIDCVLGQTYPNLELIISDNASTDSTAAIAERYAATDERVTYHRAEVNGGVAWNFNRVVELATGPFFKWMACDDLIEPEFVEVAVAGLSRHPEAVLSHSASRVIGPDGEYLRDDWTKIRVDDPDPVRRFRAVLIEPHTCMWQFGVIRLDVLRSLPWQPIGGYSHADGVLLERLALIGPFHHSPEALFSYRRHPGQSMAQFAKDEGGLDRHAFAAFFDPDLAGRLVFPTWRLLRENLASALRCPIPLRTRAAATAMVARWTVRKRRSLFAELGAGIGTAAVRTRRRVASRD
jgi:glycosyltransferase involved in cell wall biosynthesis